MPQVAQGGTLRLRAEYKNSTGALTDPTTPLVDILNPSGGLVVTGAVPTRQSLGYFYYDRVVGVSDTLGDWTIRWTGIIDGGTQEAEETFTVVAPGSLTPTDPAMLVTLEEYKERIKETSSANDDEHEDAIRAASAAILGYTDRDFGTVVVTENRDYAYIGSGFLNIDDASVVHSVTLGSGTPLPSTAWRAKSEGPAAASGVIAYLELPPIDWSSASMFSLGQMGFLQNLDRFLLYAQPGNRLEINVTVNADYGWTVVPEDVKLAVIWTAHEFEELTPSAGSPGDLSSHTVAEVTESWFGQPPARANAAQYVDAIPAKARAILDAYARAPL